MGLDVNAIKFLLWARQENLDFSRVMMIGRQKLYLNVHSLQAALATFGVMRSKGEVAAMLAERQGYAEPVFKFLGAVETASIDASSYEGASTVLDMNEAVPEDLKARFSVVFDGGTLEHVFNFPVAIRNCMEMVRLNGHFIGITPCNNYLGHGFYQFSPELFFRIFTDQNGFKLEKAILYENSPAARWYRVQDPEEVGERVEVRTRRNTLLIVQARRTAIRPLFATAPQQSDYAALWRGRSSANPPSPTLISRIKMRVPTPVKRVVWNLRERTRPRINSKALKEIQIPECD